MFIGELMLFLLFLQNMKNYSLSLECFYSNFSTKIENFSLFDFGVNENDLFQKLKCSANL